MEKKTFTYETTGTCSKTITIELNKDIIEKVVFQGGCNGNLQGISKLSEGKSVGEIIQCLKGIDCKNRGTSCPDQLAKALELMTN